MADYRTIPTSIWREDEWFMDQPIEGRLLWLWMQTNSEASKPWQPIDADKIMREVHLPANVCGELAASASATVIAALCTPTGRAATA